MQAELIYNPHAGPVVIRRELEFVVAFMEKAGWTVLIREPSAPLEAARLAREAASRGVDMVVAVGGDGTVNEVASGLVHTETIMGVLPVGTTNVWALQMHIPAPNPVGPSTQLARLVSDLEGRIDRPLPQTYYRSLLLAAAKVLTEGRVATVDMGQANGRYFLLWAGVGLDAAVSVNVPPESKKALGPLAFVGTALDTLRYYKSARVRLTLDGQVKEVDTSLIVVSNVQLYAGILPLGARACIDDGRLDVCVFRGEGLFNFVQHTLKVVSRQHVQDSQIDYYQGQEIVVESDRPFPVHVDDEPFTYTPVSIHVVPQALRVVLPDNVPAELFISQRQDRCQLPQC